MYIGSVKDMHDNRCEYATTEPCTCSCGGTYHGRMQGELILGVGEMEMFENMGGEVEQFLKENRGKRYDCYGTHPARGSSIHFAYRWFGYEHDGGLADKNGTKWWLFTVCTHPRSRKSPYQTSFAHFENAKFRANL